MNGNSRNANATRLFICTSLLPAIALGVTMAPAAGASDKRKPSSDATMPRSPQEKLTAQPRPPAIIAVRFHHDRCPYCKLLAPAFNELMVDDANESVLFVTLDLTTPATQRQATLLTGALGLDALWPGDYSALATVTFLDGRSRKVLARYRAGDGTPLEEALRKAVDSATRP